MRPRPKGLSIRYYISALLILVSAAGLALAWDIYRESAEIDLQPPSKTPAPQAEVDIGQMEALFRQQPSNPSRYQVIAEKNLFSENRRAVEDEGARRAGQKNAPERKEEVQLLGTSIMGEHKSAMMRFLLFSDKKRTHVLEQGQTVKNEGEDGPSYTIVKVEQRRVTLEDQSGQTFSVSMSEPELAQAPSPNPAEAQTGEPADGQSEADSRIQDMSQGGRGTPDPAARMDPPEQKPESSRPETGQAGKAAPAPTTSADNTTSGTWNVIR